MASIGAAWADGTWDVNSWALGAWQSATTLAPSFVTMPNITRYTNVPCAVDFHIYLLTGAEPITWTVTAGSLPTPITLSGSTGIASGTDASAGTEAGIRITASNSFGSAQTSAFSWITTALVSGSGGNRLLIAPNRGLSI